MLKALEGIDGLGTPSAVGVATEVAAVGQGLLDFFVSIGSGLLLGPAPGDGYRFLAGFSPGFGGCFGGSVGDGFCSGFRG